MKLTDKIDSLDKLMDYIMTLRNPEKPDRPVLNPAAVNKLTEKLGELNEENFWKWREHIRMVVSDHKLHKPINKPVVLNKYIFDPMHFLHLSIENPEMVAYTPDENKGKRDIQVRTTIGRYIKKQFVKSDDEVRAATIEFAMKYIPPKLLFAETGQEMVNIYEIAPFGSCMKMEKQHIKTETHPVACYGTPDFRLAYFNNEDGKVGARSIVVPSDPEKPYEGGKYVRIYGDTERMTKVLADASYVCDTHAYRGKRLKKIIDMKSRKYLCPYLDGSNQYIKSSPDGEYWIINNSGDFSGANSVGYTTAPIPNDTPLPAFDCTCGNCATRGFTEEMTVSVYHRMHICNDCFENEYARVIIDLQENTDVIRTDITSYCEDTGNRFLFREGFRETDMERVFTEDAGLRLVGNCVSMYDNRDVFYRTSDCRRYGVDENGEDIWFHHNDPSYRGGEFFWNTEEEIIVYKADEEYKKWQSDPNKESNVYDPELYIEYHEWCSKERERKKAQREGSWASAV